MKLDGGVLVVLDAGGSVDLRWDEGKTLSLSSSERLGTTRGKREGPIPRQQRAIDENDIGSRPENEPTIVNESCPGPQSMEPIGITN